MKADPIHTICFLSLLFATEAAIAQSGGSDSVARRRVIIGDTILLLNKEGVKSIRFDGIRRSRSPETLLNSDFPIYFDETLPVIEKVDTIYLTLKPYNIFTTDYFRSAKDTLQILNHLDPGPGPSGSTASPGASIVHIFDMEGTLRRIFWKSERARRRNAKRAYVIRNY